MSRGLMHKLTKLGRMIHYLQSKLCKQCKYSSHYGLKMCDKHSNKNWAEYEAMRGSMGKVMLEQTKSGKGFVRIKSFKLFPFLTFFDKLKLIFYRRK